MVELLAPDGTEWDSPVVGPAVQRAADSGTRRLRPARATHRERKSGSSCRPPRPETSINPQFSALGNGLWALRSATKRRVGSNNWVVCGTPDRRRRAAGRQRHAPHGARAEHVVSRVARMAAIRSESVGSVCALIGITLPGVPALVVGSNTHVAWGFTNTYADWSDLVLLDVDPQDPTRYRTPDGWRDLRPPRRGDRRRRRTRRTSRRVSWTIWGPVLEPDHHGRPRAIRWVAHDAERLAVDLGRARERRAPWTRAFDAVNGLGAPGQNFVVADAQGHIGWTVYGSIPRRVGFDGRLPQSWADGSRGWSGWLSPAEYPRVRDPESGRIWTANARVVDGDMLNGSATAATRSARGRASSAIGSWPENGSRPPTCSTFSSTRSASFLARWRDLALRTLTPAAMCRPAAHAANSACSSNRHGTATRRPSSPGYRLTRMFREEVSDAVIAFVLVRVLRGRPLLRLPGGSSSRRPDLEAGHRTADASARSGV